MSSAQVILSARCWFFTEFKLIMLPEGSLEHSALDKFSLFSKAFLSISNAPLWQVEGKCANFWGRAVFPALRCQEMSKRSFFTSKKIDRFGFVTQPDQASVPRVAEYKWSGRTNRRRFTSGPQGRNGISKSLRFFLWACGEFQKQTDLLVLASDEKNTALPVVFRLEIYSSNVKMSWTPPTACSLLLGWRIGGPMRGGYGRQTLVDQLVRQGQGNLEVPVQQALLLLITFNGWVRVV